jgi:predicted RNase H-like HicB family nuclease
MNECRKYRIGVEHAEPGKWVAYVFDLPGCFDSGSSSAEATARILEVIQAYFAWRRRHGDVSKPPDDFGAEITEVLDTDGRLRTTSLGVVHDVWAFFDDDRRQLANTEAEDVSRLLAYSRMDLLASVPSALTEETGKILLHVGSAEWWYLDRLGLASPKAELSDDVMHRLDQVRSTTRQILPGLVGRDEIVERDGETWSARKFVRRVIWHERDHTQHLASLTTD